MKEIKLRPCLFCGAYKVKIRVLNPDDNYYVLCQECDTKSGAYDTRLFAAKVWNTRAGDKEPYQTKKRVRIQDLDEKLDLILDYLGRQND